MATRAAYQREYQAQLRVWDANVKQWKAKTSSMTAGARSRYEDELKTLAAGRALAQKRFDDLVQHEADMWEPLQELAEQAWGELRRATTQADAVFGPSPAGSNKP
jgi:hypothetical protein